MPDPPDDDLLKTHLSLQGDSSLPQASMEEDRVPVLIVLQGDDIGRRYLINERSLVIGRHPHRAQLILTGDLEVSSTHVTIQHVAGRFVATDLASTNGTAINGQPLAPHEPTQMDDGDRLFVGRTVMKFTFQDQLEEDFHVHVERVMNIDELTGLVVKRAFDRLLEFALGAALETGAPLSVLMMDMDGLKRINDSHGHHVGAGTISQVGHILGEIVNPRGCVTRFGGDEFTAFLDGCPRKQALAIAEEIRAAVEGHHFEISGTVVHPTISIGVSSIPQDGRQAAEVVRAADAALYRAKGAGRNCVSE